MQRADTPRIYTRIKDPDLTTDSEAKRALKDEKVSVEFAAVDGELVSAVGVNHYALGDAIITGATGDRWSVSRDRFDVKYDPEPPTARGHPGNYRNRPAAVLAKRIDQAFTVARSLDGDILHGDAGDWLIQYAPGDFGIVDKIRFERIYLIIEDEDR